MNRGNPMFYGALGLTLANLLLRLASMSFQVYLSGRIGAAGIGLMQLILSVTAMSFTVGAAGVRTCAMYLSAEARGRRRPQAVRAALAGCAQYSLLFGTLAAAGLWALAPLIAARWIGEAAAAPSLRLYALFLPLRCLNGVMTGYFTAAGRIRDLVGAEFLEQGCAMAVTFALLTRWAGADTGRACLSVVAGGCGAAALSLAVMWRLYRRSVPRAGRREPPPYGRILRTALPLGLTDTFRSGLNTAENLIIPRRLALFSGTAAAMAGYGTLHGMVFPVLLFPAAILMSLAELLVPEFSRCAAAGSRRRVRYLARRGLRVALLFGLAAGAVLYAGAPALGELLYRSPAAGVQLRLYAPFVPLLYMDAIVDAMCKGLGQQSANARYNAFTSLLDVVLLWLLLPRFGLDGYYVSFAAVHLVNFALSLRRLVLASGVRMETALPLRAALCAAAAGAAAAALPAEAGAMGVLAPGAACLLLLTVLWSAARVVSREDLWWLVKLVRGRKREIG